MRGMRAVTFQPVEARVLDVEARVRGSRVLYVARLRLRYPVMCSGERMEKEATISFEKREVLEPILLYWEAEYRARRRHRLEIPVSELVGCRIIIPDDSPEPLPWATERMEARILHASITALTSWGHLVVETVAEARAGELAGTVEARLLCHPRRSVADCLRSCLAAHVKPAPKPSQLVAALILYGWYRVKVLGDDNGDTEEQELPKTIDCTHLSMKEPYPLNKLRGLLAAHRAARTLAWLLEKSTTSIDVLEARGSILGTRLRVKLNPRILGVDAPGCICGAEPRELELAVEQPQYVALEPLAIYLRAARQKTCRNNLLQFLEQWSPSHQTNQPT